MHDMLTAWSFLATLDNWVMHQATCACIQLYMAGLHKWTGDASGEWCWCRCRVRAASMQTSSDELSPQSGSARGGGPHSCHRSPQHRVEVVSLLLSATAV